MKKIKLLLIFLLPLIGACSHKKRNLKQLNIPIEKIAVDARDSTRIVNYSDFFKQTKIIALETNPGSVIGTIKRISLYKHKYFILNKETKNILVFSEGGKFLYKIGSKGKGSGGYKSLMDFTIDEKKNNLVLYSDRPYKLLTYDLQGKFLTEEYIDALYAGLTYSDDNLFLLNKDPDQDYRVLVKSPDDSQMDGYLAMNNSDKVFRKFSTSDPYLVKSKASYIVYPFCDTIFMATQGQVVPRYVIDFGKDKLPNSVFDSNSSPQKIFKLANQKKYGYRITNFRETNDHIIFIFGMNRILIYSKKTKQTKSFLAATGKGLLPIVNFYAHDGNDDNFVSVMSSYDFTEQMDLYHDQPAFWNKLPDSIKLLHSKITVASNPLLIVSALK